MSRKQQTSNPTRKVFVENLVLDVHIGCYDHEQGQAQPVRIDFELDVVEPDDPTSDSLEDVVCYNRLTQGIKAIIAEGHIKLVETLAERIAELAIEHDMVLAAKVRVAKPEAIPEAAAAGVVIERAKV